MPTSVEERLAALEVEVARIKAQVDEEFPAPRPWWEQIRGTFRNDPVYDEAMRLGRDWRVAQKDAPTDASS